MIHKLIVVGVLGMLISVHARAQFENLELSVGPGRTSTHGDQNDGYGLSYDPLYNYSISVGTRYKMTTRSGLKARLIFEDRGSKGSINYRFIDEGDPIIGANKPTYKANVKCLTLPVLYSFQFGSKVKFSLDVGPHLSYELNTRTTAYTSTGTSSYNDQSNEPFRFGATVSFGMDIPVTDKLGITVGFLDNLSIATIGDSSNQINTNTLNLLTGVRYTLKQKS